MIDSVPSLPLSPSQELLCHWDHFTPQNSAQVLLLDAPPDADVVEMAWQGTLRELGLGRVHLDDEKPRGYSHEIWSGIPPAPLVSQHSDDLPILSYVQREMNRRFPSPPVMPYRAFALRHREGCYLGIVYQQWVADSVSVRILLREWYLRIANVAKARQKFVELPRPAVARGPAFRLSLQQFVRGVHDAWLWRRQERTLARLPQISPDDTYVLLRQFTLDATETQQLLLITRAEGITLTDLLLAVAAGCLKRQVADGGEKKVAVTTSIDLRPYIVGDLSETFGHLMAQAPVVLSGNETNMLNLAQEAARQTRRLKNPDKLGQKLLLSRLIAWRTRNKSPQAFRQYCRRHFPIVAGIANVNLNKSWAALHHPTCIRQYLRVGCPNPGVPVTFSVSTFGDSMNIVAAMNRGHLDDEKASALIQDFAQTLRSLLQSVA